MALAQIIAIVAVSLLLIAIAVSVIQEHRDIKNGVPRRRELPWWKWWWFGS